MTDAEILLKFCADKDAKKHLMPHAKKMLAILASSKAADVLLRQEALPKDCLETIIREHKLTVPHLLEIKRHLVRMRVKRDDPIVFHLILDIQRTRDRKVIDAYYELSSFWLALLENRATPTRIRKKIVCGMDDADLPPAEKACILFTSRRKNIISDDVLLEKLKASWVTEVNTWLLWRESHGGSKTTDELVARFLWEKRGKGFADIHMGRDHRYIPEDLIREMYQFTQREYLLHQEHCPKDLILKVFLSHKNKHKHLADSFRETMLRMHPMSKIKKSDFDHIEKVVNAASLLVR